LTLAVMAAFEAVQPLPLAFQYLGRTREAGRRLLEIVRTPPMAVFPDQTPVRPQGHSLTFEQVAFRYGDDGPLVLNGLDFHISSGRRWCLLGQTGSGKSTLINLLARFWAPASGRILVGGCAIETFSQPDLRRHITVVSQQPHLFATTIRENLLIAKPDAADSDLTAALEAAQLLEFVSGLPDGLDTWVGEAGRQLSGGQAKRLSVARALLHDAPIWVLDEPTEGLDRATAERLMRQIYNRTQGKTLLLITHREVDMGFFDKVVFLESGRIGDERKGFKGSWIQGFE
jgi:ATP-binding cassette subfamily C protein CydC